MLAFWGMSEEATVLYAIIQSGGKQYRVSAGDLIRVERLDGQVGDQVSFDEVLFIGNGEQSLGHPVISEARVIGIIAEQGKGEKVLVFKFKRRKMYRRKRGHRQFFTAVKIDRIEFDGQVVAGTVEVGAKAELEAEKEAEKEEAPLTFNGQN